MIRILALIVSLLGASAASAATNSDQRAAQKALGTTVDMECVRAVGGDLDVEWRPVDLNEDGQVEYLVFVGGTGNGASSCFGQAGRSIHLLSRTKSGKWREDLGFGASDVRMIVRGSGRWDDLEIQGPGFCFPIWRNDGAGYRIHKTCR